MPGVTAGSRARLNRGNESTSSAGPLGIHPRYHVGTILWLPKEEELVAQGIAVPAIDKGCLDHPVVVLSLQSRNGKIVVLVVTSFGERSLAEKHPNDARARLQHLPIAPAPAHPDTGLLLTLQGKALLDKCSYVKTSQQLEIAQATLRPYRGKKVSNQYILSPESYKLLASHVGLTPPPAAERPSQISAPSGISHTIPDMQDPIPFLPSLRPHVDTTTNTNRSLRQWQLTTARELEPDLESGRHPATVGHVPVSRLPAHSAASSQRFAAEIAAQVRAAAHRACLERSELLSNPARPSTTSARTVSGTRSHVYSGADSGPPWDLWPIVTYILGWAPFIGCAALLCWAMYRGAIGVGHSAHAAWEWVRDRLCFWCKS